VKSTVVTIRVPPSTVAAIEKRRAKVKKQTGIEPRISDVVRAMLAESAEREVR
jgi:hypothetical protein